MKCPTLTELPQPLPQRSGWPWICDSGWLRADMVDDPSWPRISIVTPSFNQGHFLEETIRSVLLQGYPNLEYIVLDGGSADESIGIIRKYEQFLAYAHIGADEGQADAIAKGFDLATGQIMGWINSDDRYRPGSLARVGAFFAGHPDVVFGSGDVNVIDQDGRYVQRLYSVRPTRFLTANLGVHRWPQQGCFWKKDVYHKVGGIDRTLRFCMDRDLFLRIVAEGKSRRIPGPTLADFRVHPAAKSSTLLEIARAENHSIVTEYGSPLFVRHRRLLRIMWLAWTLPAIARECADRFLSLGLMRKGNCAA